MSDYTVLRAADAPDYTGEHPGAFLGYARPMASEQLAVNVRVLEPGMTHVPPGGDPTRGHSHRTIEEIYFVLDGELTIKDQTHPVEARGTITGPTETLGGAVKIGVDLEALVDRTQFGLSWNAPLPGGGVALGSEVKLVVELELAQSEE